MTVELTVGRLWLCGGRADRKSEEESNRERHGESAVKIEISNTALKADQTSSQCSTRCEKQTGVVRIEATLLDRELSEVKNRPSGRHGRTLLSV